MRRFVVGGGKNEAAREDAGPVPWMLGTVEELHQEVSRILSQDEEVENILATTPENLEAFADFGGTPEQPYQDTVDAISPLGGVEETADDSAVPETGRQWSLDLVVYWSSGQKVIDPSNTSEGNEEDGEPETVVKGRRKWGA